MDDESSRKKHRPRQSGVKADKKRKRKLDGDAKQRNPKAFAIQSANKAARIVRRNLDRATKKEHIPYVNRTPDEPPPIVVAVVGPPKVGKTTLIRGLVRHYSKQAVTSIEGPVTLVSGKKKRITFVECPNDVSAMIDVAKVADLVLLLVDAGFGFEMEVFEFLNICQVHGFPRIMGVLTHLDSFKNMTAMRRAKKQLKHRFWTEVYQGAKLFYFSGTIRESYPKTELQNLGRFISVMKFRQLQWRSTHPFILVDRVEDVSEPEELRLNPKLDRRVCLYGYVRGTHLKENSNVHIPGCGDFILRDVSVLNDPCALPSQEKKRSLNEKERLVYAPMSGLGGVVYDKDAVYIEVKKDHVKPAPNEFVTSMMDTEHPLDEKMDASEMTLVKGGVSLPSATFENHKDEEEEEERVSEEVVEFNDGRIRRRAIFKSENDDVDSDDDVTDDDVESEAEESLVKWKSELASRAAERYVRGKTTLRNMQRHVYGRDFNESEEGEGDRFEEVGGMLVTKKQSINPIDKRDESNVCDAMSHDWANEDLVRQLKDVCFVTGKWSSEEDAATRLAEDNEDVYGNFEDLETGETHEETENGETKRMSKKKKLKEKFDAEYDEGVDTTFYEDLKQSFDAQAQLNRTAFVGMDDDTRYQLEGYRPGLYVRVEISRMPCEFVANFNPLYPVIIGGLLSGENRIGYVQARFKKHRWHKKILKTRDPLIVSMGWRRFQTLALYSIQDHNGRDRLVKYTPEHAHCIATFYGPISPQGTGVLSIQGIASNTPDFRISGTGVVLSQDKSINIVKKLKLIGTPYKIFKNTAFIKGMFKSALEVAKFEGASIRTVSNIRGQLKKGLRTPEGAFRATFEDKILLSDIVFLRTWFTVDLPRYYNPVTTLLLEGTKHDWTGMKTVGQMRWERGLKAPHESDSSYTSIRREPKVFKPFKVPASLQKQLPFKTKPKDWIEQSKKTSVLHKRAVVREPREKEISSLIHRIHVAYKEKIQKKRQVTKRKRLVYQKQMKEQETKRTAKVKEVRKIYYRMLGKAKNKASQRK